MSLLDKKLKVERMRRLGDRQTEAQEKKIKVFREKIYKLCTHWRRGTTVESQVFKECTGTGVCEEC